MVGYDMASSGYDVASSGYDGDDAEDVVSLRLQFLEDADPFRLHVFPQPLRPRLFPFHAQLVLRNQILEMIDFLGCNEYFSPRVSGDQEGKGILVACTRLYKSLCLLVHPSITFFLISHVVSRFLPFFEI